MKTTVLLFSFMLLPFAGQAHVTTEKISKYLTLEGEWCSGIYMLTADFGKKGGTWQWSKDGIMLEGEVSNAINLSKYGTGKFVVMYTASNNKVIHTDEYEFKTLPGVKADYSYDYLHAAGAVKFKNLTTGNTAEYTWHWDFGDGTTSTDLSPVKLYEEEGTYTVTLTVTDANGCSNKTSLQVVWQYPR